MIRRAFVLALPLLLSAPAAVPARHGGVVLDARRATPGIELRLEEMAAVQASPRVRYQLHVTGVPRNLTFAIWTKDFGASFQQVHEGFRTDERGTLVAVDSKGQPRRLDELVLEPGPYPQGAAWEVGLVSDDRTVKAFARVIPRPIAARNGACAVGLELVSRRGDRFIASGDGFVPGEEVTIASQVSGRIMHHRTRVGEDGRLFPDVISHRTGDNRAQYLVKGQACAVAVAYESGEAALARR